MSKASEGILDDSVVYVTKQGSQVGVDGGRNPDEDLRRVAAARMKG